MQTAKIPEDVQWQDGQQWILDHLDDFPALADQVAGKCGTCRFWFWRDRDYSFDVLSKGWCYRFPHTEEKYAKEFCGEYQAGRVGKLDEVDLSSAPDPASQPQTPTNG